MTSVNKRKSSGKIKSGGKLILRGKSAMSGRGRMTQIRMKKWSSYYQKAFVDFAPDVPAMKNAIWAIFSTLYPPWTIHTTCFVMSDGVGGRRRRRALIPA